MPRILPRLLEKIAHSQEFPSKSWKPFSLPRQRPRSLYKSVPSHPSLNPIHYTKSILLTPSETNPITSSRIYVRHKSLPPRLRLSGRVKSRPGQSDRPRAMTDEERQWWSNPYLRMLASPIRQCITTKRCLPMDFQIRLALMRLPQGSEHTKVKQELFFIPDGLQHTKFTARKSGKANYILCSRDEVSALIKSKPKNFGPNKVIAHTLLADQIGHLLRVRVLQELELLGDEMESSINELSSASRIIRRLTRDEWNAIRETGLIPYSDALAVLVVPPIQRDPVTKEKPEPSMSTSPIIEKNPVIPTRSSLPISTLHSLTAVNEEAPTEGNALPQAQIPLYNGVTLFSIRAQRAALLALLTRLLSIESKSRRATSLASKTEHVMIGSPGGKRASHAFLLSCDAETIRRGDAAAVGIALWRLRMFEGGG